MAFTTGGLFQRESIELAGLYMDIGDWEKVGKNALERNLLQTRTLATLKRVCREVLCRLKTLSDPELSLLVQGSHDEQSQLLWLAVCRRYVFIGQFASEVLRERFLTLQRELANEDFDAFFNRKSEWHPELERITPATRLKLRQVAFKMMREANLLTPHGTIIPAVLSPRLVEFIRENSPDEIIYFPNFES